MLSESDRELLELAAKAAGIDGVWHEEWRCLVYMGAPPFVGGVIHHTWSPLTDDGDALRLAVKMGMDVVTGRGRSDAYCRGVRVSEYNGDDPYAATRRAIVRAAAEIGRQDDH